MNGYLIYLHGFVYLSWNDPYSVLIGVIVLLLRVGVVLLGFLLSLSP